MMKTIKNYIEIGFFIGAVAFSFGAASVLLQGNFFIYILISTVLLWAVSFFTRKRWKFRSVNLKETFSGEEYYFLFSFVTIFLILHFFNELGFFNVPNIEDLYVVFNSFLDEILISLIFFGVVISLPFVFIIRFSIILGEKLNFTPFLGFILGGVIVTILLVTYGENLDVVELYFQTEIQKYPIILDLIKGSPLIYYVTTLFKGSEVIGNSG